MPLRKVTHRVTGLLPFWINVDHGLSKHCTNYKSSAAMGGIVFEIDPERHDEEMEKLLSNGADLGEHRWGFAVGIIELPKNAMVRHRHCCSTGQELQSMQTKMKAIV